MQSVQTIKFQSGITRENSHTPKLENLGNAQCSMELFTPDGTAAKNGSGHIEWYVEYLDADGTPDGDDDVEQIGVWFENKTLTDYDGVFSLPKQAVQLLREVGIIVPSDFEN